MGTAFLLFCKELARILHATRLFTNAPIGSHAPGSYPRPTMNTRYSPTRFCLLMAALPALAPLACKKTAPPDPPPNFYTLEPGGAYRSSQPTADQLRILIDAYKIRTIINLRGANPGQPWYDAETTICEKTGVKLADHRMSSKELPSGQVLADIVKTLQTADYPILIHCEGGADRTGAVCSIYRILIQHQSRSTALEELSPDYHHIRDFAPCMDTLAEIYEPTPGWLAWYTAHAGEIRCNPSPASSPATSPASMPTSTRAANP